MAQRKPLVRRAAGLSSRLSASSAFPTNTGPTDNRPGLPLELWHSIARYSVKRSIGAVPSNKLKQIKKRLFRPWRDSPPLLDEAEKQFWLMNEIHLHIKLRKGVADYIGDDRTYLASDHRRSIRRLHLLIDIWDHRRSPIDLVGDTEQVLQVIAQDFTRLDSLTVNLHVMDFSLVPRLNPRGASMRADLDRIIHAIRAIASKETILIRTDLLSHPDRGEGLVPLGLVQATLKEDQIETAYAKAMATWTDSIVRDAYLQMEMGKGLRIS